MRYAYRMSSKNQKQTCTCMRYVPNNTCDLYSNFAGCDRCFSMDGNWKLCFTHCMFPVTAGVTELPTLNIPDICPRQLKSESAFCEQHHAVAQQLKYPTDIRGFLSFCGVTECSK